MVKNDKKCRRLEKPCLLRHEHVQTAFTRQGKLQQGWHWSLGVLFFIEDDDTGENNVLWLDPDRWNLEVSRVLWWVGRWRIARLVSIEWIFRTPPKVLHCTQETTVWVANYCQVFQNAMRTSKFAYFLARADQKHINKQNRACSDDFSIEPDIDVTAIALPYHASFFGLIIFLWSLAKMVNVYEILSPNFWRTIH